MYKTSLLDPKPCRYCEREQKAIRMTDGVCSDLECQAHLHRSYGDESFSEFCSQHDMHPAEWDEFFAEWDIQQLNEQLQEHTRTAKHALQNLIQLLQQHEHDIAQNRYDLRGIRHIRSQLNQGLEAIERTSQYKIKEAT